MGWLSFSVQDEIEKSVPQNKISALLKYRYTAVFKDN